MDILQDMPRFVTRLGDLPRATGFPFQVMSIGYLKNNWHDDERKNRDAFIFGLTFASGDGMTRRMINGREIQTRCPSFSCLCPGGYWRNLSPHPWDELYFSLSPATLDALLGLGLKLPSASAVSIDISPSMGTALRTLGQLVQNLHGTGNIDRIDNICFHIAMEALIAAFAPASGDPLDAVVREALSWIRLRYREPFDVKGFLRKRGVGYRTFLRRWSATMAKSPTQYALDTRMEEARRLLRETDLSVKAIAADLRFADQLYFSRLFRRYEGVPPREYRKRRDNGA